MNPSQKTNLFESEKTIWAILFAVLATWSFFSYTNWIGDSEFWPISLSGHWDQWKTQPALLFKPLFHLSLSWIYLFKLNSVEHIKLAKDFYTLLGAGSYVVFFQIIKRHLTIQKALCVTLIFLFSNLGFSQIGLIRSDFLSFFVVLFFFLLAPRLKEESWIQYSIVGFAFSLVLVLITPKSIFLSLLVFIYSLLQLHGKSRFRYVLAMGWLFIFAYYGTDFFIQQQGIGRGLVALVNFAEASYSDPDALPFFNHILNKYLISDAVLWILILAGLFWQVKKIFKLNKQPLSLTWILIGLYTLASIVFHKPALPFFVGSYWGLLFLGLIPVLQKFPIKYLSAVVVVTFVILIFRFSDHYHFSNSVQYKTIRQLEDYVVQIPNGKIFDGLGVVPRGPQFLFYVGPEEEQSNSQIMTLTKADRPELIVYTHRLTLLEPELGPFLQEEYESIGIGYWLRKDIKAEKNLGELPPAFFVFGFYPVSNLK